MESNTGVVGQSIEPHPSSMVQAGGFTFSVGHIGKIAARFSQPD
jgi:hypothetical protein